MRFHDLRVSINVIHVLRGSNLVITQIICMNMMINFCDQNACAVYVKNLHELCETVVLLGDFISRF